MSSYAVTVIGRDRPGIIAGITRVLAAAGANIEDSVMSRLRGTFAMTLVVDTALQADPLLEALREVAATLGVTVTVGEAVDAAETTQGAHHVLTLHGADRPGIVAEVTALLAQVGGNITEMTTRLGGDLYVLVCEVDLPPQRDSALVASELAALGDRLGVQATLRPAEDDLV